MSSIFSTLLKYKGTVVNVLTVAAGVLTYLLSDQVIAQNPGITAAIVSAVGVLNVVLHLAKEV